MGSVEVDLRVYLPFETSRTSLVSVVGKHHGAQNLAVNQLHVIDGSPSAAHTLHGLFHREHNVATPNNRWTIMVRDELVVGPA